MKNAIVKLGLCLLLLFASEAAFAVAGPTVTVAKVGGGTQRSPTGDLQFTVTFSAAVTGFGDTQTDFLVTGTGSAGWTASATGTGTTYTVTVSGLTANGTVILQIPVGAATDGTNGNQLSNTDTITFNSNPLPIITHPSTTSPTSLGTLSYQLDFDQNVTTVPVEGDFSFTGSTGGLGTLSVDAGSVTGTAPGKTFTFTVTIPTAATAPGDVKVGYTAGKVADADGNTNDATASSSSITWNGGPPTLATPTAIPTDDSKIDIFGEVLTVNGYPNLDRGTVWNSGSAPSTSDNSHTLSTHGTGTFDETRSSGIMPAHQYYFGTWADNGTDPKVLTTAGPIWTYSTVPDGGSDAVATAKSSTTINVTFDKFNSINHSNGLIILRKQGSAPTNGDLKNGMAPTVANMPLIIAVITDGNQQALTQPDGTVTPLTPGTKYYYAAVPFNWDGTHPETYNYLKNFNTDNDFTFANSSFIKFNSAAPKLAYHDFTTNSAITSATDGLSLGSFTLYDGDNISPDADALSTELKTLSIHVDNFNMIRRVAINDGGTIHTEGVLDGAGNITFNLATNKIITQDDNGGTPDQFDIIASFNPSTVVDGTIITITVTGATTYVTGTTTGSEFALPTAGGPHSGATDNSIDVVATKYVYTVAPPTNVNSNAPWAFTVTLEDTNNKVDTDLGGTVTVSEASLNPSSTAVPVDASGVATFTGLLFKNAGHKTVAIDASNGANPHDTFTIDVISLGVTITGPGIGATPSDKFCFNDVTNTNPATFKALSTITITESDGSDFGPGAGQTFSLVLPSGFIFNTTATVSATGTGTEISSALTTSYSGSPANIFRIQYDVSANTEETIMDKITLSGLMVKYIGSSVFTDQPIVRVGGTAVQQKNSETDARVLGKISSYNDDTPLDFIVNDSRFTNQAETHFDKATTPGIALLGKLVNGGTTVNGIFSGPGIAIDADGQYKFNPASLGPGVYDITFTATDGTNAAACISSVTKQFEVFTTVLNGLNPSYCIYDTPTTLGTPTNFIAGGYYLTVDPLFGFLTVAFDPAYYGTYTAAEGPYVWYDWNSGTYNQIPETFPGSQTYKFDPGSSTYTAALAASGNNTLLVGYRKKNNHFPGVVNDGYQLQSITINQRPIIDFTPDLFRITGICATDAAVTLKSDSFDGAHTFDKFWSSVPGDPSTSQAGVPTPIGGVYILNPAVANPAGTNNVSVQINYQHQDFTTKCTNQVSKVVSVWRRPPTVPTPSITIKGNVSLGGQFCQKNDPISQFEITPADPTMYYRWYNAAGTTEVGTADKPTFNAVSVIPPDPFDSRFPKIGSYSYNITQTENRDVNNGFFGCESPLQPIDLQVFQQTIADAGIATLVICQGQPVDLTALHASITLPPGTIPNTIDGVWSTVNPDTHAFKHGTNDDNTLSGAQTYKPSADEIAAGQVVLTLTSNHPPGPCVPDPSQVIVKVNAGTDVTFPISPVAYCASESNMLVQGKVVNPTLPNLGFTWQVTNGTGTISATTLHASSARYVPSATELNEGTDVTLTLISDDPDASGPCGTSQSDVHVLISQRPIVAVIPSFDICNDETITVTSRIPPTGNPTNDITKSSATSVRWIHNGTGNLGDPNALSTVYHPDATELLNAEAITFQAISNTPGGANICGADTARFTVNLHTRPGPPSPIQPTKYCVDDIIDKLRINGGSSYPSWYSDADLAPTHRISAGNGELLTGLTANAEMRVPFYVTQTTDKTASFDGCESASATMVVVVNPLPVPSFSFANQCIGDKMQFTDGSSVPPPIDTTDPPRTITSWQWNFDDNLGNTDAGIGVIPDASNQDGRTTGIFQSPKHEFKNTGVYNVKVTLVTSDGCTASFIHAPIEVGAVPVASFTSLRTCDQDATEFSSNTGIGVPVTYDWKFGDTSDNTASVANPTHIFSGAGTYDVFVKMTTLLGCKDSVTIPTSIYPYIKNFPYSQTFETANHGWTAEGTVTDVSGVTTNTSWNLVTSAGGITSDPLPGAGSHFWATHTSTDKLDVFYYNNERSVLTGPCVDMTGISRPVIAMDYLTDIEPGGDGAYIEYKDETDDINAPWKRLGDNVSGLDWYKGSSIGGLALLAGVGQDISQFGWTGTEPKQTEWKTGRYNMDQFAGSSRIRFRVVFGSNTSPVTTDVYDGFALDNFRLETRNRLVLVENFTTRSTTSSAVTGNTAAFQAFPSVAGAGEVVKIEYHTGLPATPGDPEDPLFAQNPMDPNARASFYGLSAVPRGYIDGYSNLAGSGVFNATGDWASSYYSTESLKTSPLDIHIDPPTITNGTLEIKGTVTANDFALAGNTYSLYVVVVEKTVDNDDAFVLRKMLPSASGTKVPETAQGGSFTFDQTWAIDKSNLSASPHLIAIAFVQSDIVTSSAGERQVLQAAYNDDLPVVDFTTGLEVGPELMQTAVFPNPADHMVNIELPEATKSGVEVKVIDQLGRPVLHGSIPVGEKSTSIDTGNLAATMYIVQMKENGIFTTRRLLITHKMH